MLQQLDNGEVMKITERAVKLGSMTGERGTATVWYDASYGARSEYCKPKWWLVLMLDGKRFTHSTQSPSKGQFWIKEFTA